MSTRRLVVIPLLTALTSVLAYVTIPLPFSPVPITGQTFGVMLAGSLLRKGDGAVSILLLLMLGFIGLPVFSGGLSGPGVLIGPTGGYLWAMPLSAFLTGWFLEARLARSGRLNFGTYFLAHILFGIIGIYLIGVPWLAWQQHLPLQAAVMVGALPFLPGDLLKAAAAALVAVRLHRHGVIKRDS